MMLIQIQVILSAYLVIIHVIIAVMEGLSTVQLAINKLLIIDKLFPVHSNVLASQAGMMME